MSITSSVARFLRSAGTRLSIETIADGEFLKRDGTTIVGAPGGGVGSSVDETELAFTDIATANSSTTKHGLLRKLSNIATEYLNGVGDWVKLPFEIGVAVSDETTDLTTGTSKVTFRMPCAMTLTGVRSSINTVSSSGLVTVDINEGGATILSTKLSIDQGEKTSQTAATPAVISDAALTDDAEITIDIDAAGTGAKGLKVWLIGTRA